MRKHFLALYWNITFQSIFEKVRVLINVAQYLFPCFKIFCEIMIRHCASSSHPPVWTGGILETLWHGPCGVTSDRVTFQGVTPTQTRSELWRKRGESITRLWSGELTWCRRRLWRRVMWSNVWKMLRNYRIGPGQQMDTRKPTVTSGRLHSEHWTWPSWIIEKLQQSPCLLFRFVAPWPGPGRAFGVMTLCTDSTAARTSGTRDAPRRRRGSGWTTSTETAATRRRWGRGSPPEPPAWPRASGRGPGTCPPRATPASPRWQPDPGTLPRDHPQTRLEELERERILTGERDYGIISSHDQSISKTSL